MYIFSYIHAYLSIYDVHDIALYILYERCEAYEMSELYDAYHRYEHACPLHVSVPPSYPFGMAPQDHLVTISSTSTLRHV